MSYADDFGHHEFPEFGDPIWDTIDQDKLWEKTCNKCGAGRLSWVDLNQGRDFPIWRLFDADGEIHKCGRIKSGEVGIYTTWGSPDSDYASILVEGSGPPQRRNGDILPDATKKFDGFSAANWTEATKIFYKKQGW